MQASVNGPTCSRVAEFKLCDADSREGASANCRGPFTIETGPRRPIPARDLAPSRALAAWLAARGVSANGISVAGCLAGLLAGAAFALAGTDSIWPWLIGAVLVQLRLLANMMDGMVAIARGTASRLGELFNEVPDRIADVAVLVGLGHALGGSPWLGYAAALAALGTAYLRAVGSGLGAPADFCGPMAKPHRMHVVTLTALLAVIALLADLSVVAVLGDYGIAALGLAVVLAGALITLLRRLRRLAAALPDRGPADEETAGGR